MLAKIEMRTQEAIDQEEEERRARLMRALQAQHAEAHSLLAPGSAAAPEPAAARVPPPASRPPAAQAPRGPAVPVADPVSTFVRVERKIGRNEPCPCGSGKKYKHCHGVLSNVQ